MATLAVSDWGQKKKRIITLALMAIFLMSASFFLIDRKDETIIVVSFPNGREIQTEVADTPERLLVGLAFRETLPANGGLLYIFESTGQNHVWTKEYRRYKAIHHSLAMSLERQGRRAVSQIGRAHV